MGSQATFRYETQAVGLSTAALAARVAAVPLSQDVLNFLGVRVTADATPVANPVVRTITVSFLPSVTATGTVTVKDSRIVATAITAAGNNYVVPPILSVTDVNRVDGVQQEALLKGFLKMIAIALTAGGGGYVAPTLTFLGGLPAADRGELSATKPGCVRYINLVDGGFGYPVGTTVDIVGDEGTIQAKAVLTRSNSGVITSVTITDMGAGMIRAPQVNFHLPNGAVLPTNFRPATAFAIMAVGTPVRVTLNVAAGVIAAIVIVNAGDGYTSVPDTLLQDAVGVGATFGPPQMGLGRIDIDTPGFSYTATSVLVVTPYFKSLFPDDPTNAQAQAVPFFKLFEELIGSEVHTPVFSTVPLVT
jgi:hypothetical protein